MSTPEDPEYDETEMDEEGCVFFVPTRRIGKPKEDDPQPDPPPDE